MERGTIFRTWKESKKKMLPRKTVIEEPFKQYHAEQKKFMNGSEWKP